MSGESLNSTHLVHLHPGSLEHFRSNDPQSIGFAIRLPSGWISRFIVEEEHGKWKGSSTCTLNSAATYIRPFRRVHYWIPVPLTRVTLLTIPICLSLVLVTSNCRNITSHTEKFKAVLSQVSGQLGGLSNFSPSRQITSRGSLNRREYKAAAAGQRRPGYRVVGTKTFTSRFGEVPSNHGLLLSRSLRTHSRDHAIASFAPTQTSFDVARGY